MPCSLCPFVFMSQSVKVVQSGSISFGGLLVILFIALKLTGVITWSWLWILSPLWIGLALGLTLIAVVLLALAVLGWFASR